MAPKKMIMGPSKRGYNTHHNTCTLTHRHTPSFPVILLWINWTLMTLRQATLEEFWLHFGVQLPSFVQLYCAVDSLWFTFQSLFIYRKRLARKLIKPGKILCFTEKTTGGSNHECFWSPWCLPFGISISKSEWNMNLVQFVFICVDLCWFPCLTRMKVDSL